MALPARGIVQTWVGRTVVDRDGTEIGVCTAVLTDDGTGLPEWLYAQVDQATVIVPLVDATEVGDRVQVAVSRTDVGNAPPPAGDTQHLSQGEEAALYQHYGIEYSRTASETVLPTDVVPIDESTPTVPAPAGPPPAPAPDAVAGQPDTAGAARRGRGVAAAVAVLVGLGIFVAAVLRLRRRRQSRPEPRRAGRRARAGAAWGVRAAGAAARSARAASAPLVSATGRVIRRGTRAGAASALHAAKASTRLAVAAIPRIAARGAQVAQTGLGAAITLGGAVEAVPEVVSETGKRLRKGRRKVMGRLSLGLGFGVGYVVGARAGRSRFEQIKRAAISFAERPEVQQALDKVKDAAPAPLQSTIGGLSQRASGAGAKVRRRPAGGDAVTVVPPVADADPVVATPTGSVPPPPGALGAPDVPSDGPDGPP
jgi:hypothetical protein